jgi:hypothetical protein
MTTKKLLNSILVGCISLLVFSCEKRTARSIEVIEAEIETEVEAEVATDQTYSGGGTEADPYLISSKADMEALASAVNGNSDYSSGKYFRLTQDITDTITTIIGQDDSHLFKGVFDGGGHKLTVNISTSNGYAGVFGETTGATIKNLGVAGSVSSSTAGGICGYAGYGSTITNCYNTGSVSSSSSLASSGGICGQASSSTITNCYNTGSVSSSSSLAYAGGICGYADGSTITNCYNTGSVSSSSSDAAAAASGGICGYTEGITITNCYNTGSVSSSSSLSYAGGICGVLSDGMVNTVNDCIAANTTITAKRGSNNNDFAGRIVGYIKSGDSIVNCQALASMQINGNTKSSQNANSMDGKDIVGSYEIFNAIGMLNAKQIIYGDESFLLNENNLPIYFQSSDTGIIDITKNVLTVKKSGNVVITANYTWERNDYRIKIRKKVERR